MECLILYSVILLLFPGQAGCEELKLQSIFKTDFSIRLVDPDSCLDARKQSGFFDSKRYPWNPARLKPSGS